MKQGTENRWLGELTDEHTAQLWAKVSRRVERPKRARVSEGSLARHPATWAFAALTALGVALSAVWLADTPGRPELASWSTQGDALAFTLAEGTQLELTPHSKVDVTSSSPKRVSLELGQGQMTCDVIKNPERRFSVFAGDFEVRVVGTKFMVKREVSDHGARVDVHVDRGVVEVRRRGLEERIYVVRAGQSWSSEERLAAPAEVEKAVPLDDIPPNREEERAEPERPAIENTDNDRVPLPRAKPEDRFDAARAARQAGDIRRAIQLYEQFLREFPSDSRAALAAFEVARLQMDHENNPAKALRSLDRALHLARGSRFGEDILARKVRALSALGQTASCRATRDTYLKQYPSGVHRVEVLGQCP